MIERQDLRAKRERKALFKLLEMGKERRRRTYNKIIKSLINEGIDQAHASLILAKMIEKGILRKKGIYYHKVIYEIDVKALERLLETEE